MSLDLALGLAGKGFHVFPVVHTDDNKKLPLKGTKGLLDASTDIQQIETWWKEHPNCKVGVNAGLSGLNILDVDTKNGKNGWDSLAENWLEVPETFSYDTGTGGKHFVYWAPEDVHLNGTSDYRGLQGIDRRAGSSFVMWVGEVPNLGDIKPAPEWLNDPAQEKKVFQFEGELQDWYNKLVQGEPNVLVRKAMERVSADMSHSEMVSAQHAAIRLGAEGNPGVPELLDLLRDAWENRPPENHTTPESDWGFKFEEALHRGFTEFGGLIDQLKNLKDYSIELVPKAVSDTLITTPNGKQGFSKLLGALVKETSDDDLIASILWGAPATRELAREWGLLFVHDRIQKARVKPEPVRENPRVEEVQEQELKEPGLDTNLLTDEEREYLKSRPSFANRVEEIARDLGYDQLAYFRAVAWNMLSLTLGLKAFIPISGTQRLGLNLWNVTVGYSGTGKSVVIDFRDQILRLVMDDTEGVPGYDLGAGSSIEGLHDALLERDGAPSLFATDEASGFFKKLSRNDWNAGMEDTLSAWYMGWVPPSSKVRLKEKSGKGAKTSFNMQMFATPDRLTESVTREQFMSGFLARVCWVKGHPPKEDDDRFNVFRLSDDTAVARPEDVPPSVKEVALDLVTLRALFDKPVNLEVDDVSQVRVAEAYKRMFKVAQRSEHFDIVEPSITRLIESMIKVSGLCAMYRGDTVVNLDDTLHAVKATEEWFQTLFVIAEMISAGDFQRGCDEIEAWVTAKGGASSKSAILNRFKNTIVKDKRELESKLDFLVDSGIFNREEVTGGVRYVLNGSV